VAAGSDTQVQFNDGGAFGGDAGLTYDKATDALTVAGVATVGSLTTSAAYPGGSVTCRDVFAHRNNDVGAMQLGNSNTHYLTFNSANFLLSNTLVVDGYLGVNSTAGPGAPLDVQVYTDRRFILTHDSGYPQYGILSATAWHDMYLQAETALLMWFDNTLSCGDSGHRWTAVWAANGTIQTSDARLKKDIVDSPLGLDFIETLRPVSYKWIEGINKQERVVVGEEVVPAYYTIDNVLVPATTRPVYEDRVTPLPGVRQHFGLIAQEVSDAVKASGVVDFGGFVRGGDPTLLPDDQGVDPDGTVSLRYDEFIAPMIKAIQELSARVKTLEAQLGTTP